MASREPLPPPRVEEARGPGPEVEWFRWRGMIELQQLVDAIPDEALLRLSDVVLGHWNPVPERFEEVARGMRAELLEPEDAPGGTSSPDVDRADAAGSGGFTS